MQAIRSLCALSLILLTTCPLMGEQGLNVLLKGKRQTILPLGFDARYVVALQRNGFMLNVEQRQLKEPKIVPQWRAFSQQEMRAELLHEFGRHFEVTGTGNYLVVHPRGARDLWANRFEELYRSMIHFFRTRRFPMQKPQYPLVAIVFYSQQQYIEYNRRALDNNASGTAGVYIPRTNRIYLYDDTKGQGASSSNWQENLATIMHEAAHQTAFNCGIHQRAGETPYWIAEGLGCMFEAKGIYDAFKHRSKQDRLNYGRLYYYQQKVQPDAASLIGSVVASDKLFRRDPGRAYAMAWAMTYYLSERESRKYIAYLKTVAARKPLTAYPATTRIREFNAAFGRDYDMLAVRVTRFLEDQPKHGRQ